MDDLTVALSNNTMPKTNSGSVLLDAWFESAAQFLPAIGGYPPDRVLFNMVLWDMLETTKNMSATLIGVQGVRVWLSAHAYLKNPEGVDRAVFHSILNNIGESDSISVCFSLLIRDWDAARPSVFPCQSAVAYHREVGLSRGYQDASAAAAHARFRLQTYIGFWEVGQIPLITEGPELAA